MNALDLLAVDPGLGACLRGGPGPSRDGFLAGLRAALPPGTPWRRVPATVDAEALLGGLDLVATLAAGRPVRSRGLLAALAGGILVVGNAERLGAGTAALLAAETWGAGAPVPAIVLLDEGGEDRPPVVLRERLAIEVTLSERLECSVDVAAARATLPWVRADDGAIVALTQAAAALGITSLRAPLHALRVARAAAAAAGRAVVADEDLALAAALVLAPRATQLPVPPAEEPPAPTPGEATTADEGAGRLADVVLEAARAALPPGVLAALAAGAMRSKEGGRAGARQRAPQRGRTIGVRRGEPRGGARLAVLDTLRAAAPWQRVRGATPGHLAIRRDDFRIRRFAARTRTTTVFVVDASGSAALHRLAEAKGAVELLLADCYVRRDRVALLAVRGEGAELLLPPTNSLARAKRSLAALPGGGGTPLAAGIEAATLLADQIRRGGQTPATVFLTDGRANIALDGAAGRARAEADAETCAARFRAADGPAVLIDTGPNAHPFAARLASVLGAKYLRLPRADARAIAASV